MQRTVVVASSVACLLAFVSAGQAQQITSIVNGASFIGGPVAPGEMVAIFGSGLGPAALAQASLSGNSLPTSLAGTQVLFDQTPAPLQYVSATQLAAYVPYGLAGRSTTQIRVTVGPSTSNTVTLGVAAAAIGLNTQNASGTGLLAAVKQNFTPLTPSNRPVPGEVVTFLGTGMGQTNPPGQDGVVALGGTLPRAILPVRCQIGGQDAEVLYAGLAPALVSQAQFNVRVPSGVGGDQVPVVVFVGDSQSQPGVYIPVDGPVSAPPLQASPASLSFVSQVGASFPPSQSLLVTSTSQAAFSLSVASTGSWLSAVPSSGTTPQSVSISANTSGLSAGQYTGTISIAAGSFSVQVPVTLTVSPPTTTPVTPLTFTVPLSPANEIPPITTFNPSGTAVLVVRANQDNNGQLQSGSVDFEVNYRFPSTVTIVGLHIHRGRSDENGVVVIGTDITAANPVTDASGQGVVRRRVDVDPSNIAAIEALRRIFTHPSDFYVNLHTTSHPTGVLRGQLGVVSLTVSPSSLNFIGSAGSTIPPQHINLGSISGAVSFVASPTTFAGGNWLSVTPLTGSTPALLQVTARTDGLAAGTYSASIRATAESANAEVPVSLTVTSAPLPSGISIVSGNNQSGNVGSELEQRLVVRVSRSDGSAAAGSAVVWEVLSGSATLVAPGVVTDSNGMASTGVVLGSSPGPITIRARTGALEVTFSLNATTTPQPTLNVSPSSLSFSTSGEASQTVAISSSANNIVNFNINASDSWISLSQSNGQTPITLTVSVNATVLTPGRYNGSLTITGQGIANSPVTVGISLTVPAPTPNIRLSTSSLPFSFQTGGAQPAAQTINIDSSGEVLNFTVAATQATGNWLQAFANRSTTPAVVSVTVDPTDLNPNTYTGTITITALGAANSPQSVAVSLIVTSPPTSSRLVANPADGLQFRHQTNAVRPSPQSLFVTSSGDSISFTANASVRASGPSWLSVQPRNATTNTALQISVNPAGLSSNTYDGEITLIPSGSGQETVRVPVRLTVSPRVPSRLDSDTRQLTFFAPSATAPQQNQVTILNPGTDLLNFEVRVEVDGPSTWLRVSRTTGGADSDNPASVVVTADPKDLTPATYTGKIVIQAQGSEERLEIPAAMTVGRTPRKLVVSHTALNFTAVANSADSPAAQTLDILSFGQGSLNFTTRVSSATPWLTVSQGQNQAGAQQPGHLRVQINSQGLDAREYSGQIEIDSPDADNRPQIVTVVLRVLPAGQKVGPVLLVTGMTFVATAGGSNPSPQDAAFVSPDRGQFTASTLLDPDTPPGTSDWLRLAASRGGFDPLTAIGTLRVSPVSQGLPAGIYRGTVTILFPGNISRTIAVLLVVSVGTANAGKNAPRAADACQAQQYLPLFSSLEQRFSLATGEPATTELVIVDDCGRLVSSGSAGSTFSSRDRPLDLIPLGDGRWRASWVPRRSAEQGIVTVNVSATDTGQTIGAGKAPPVTGFLQGTLAAPVLNSERPITGPDGQIQLAVAPGSLIKIRGSRLADPNNPERTTVTLGAHRLELQLVSAEEITALVPMDVPVSTNVPLVVTQGELSSAPESVLVAESFPVVRNAVQSQGGTLLTLTGLGKTNGGRLEKPLAVRTNHSQFDVQVVELGAKPGVYHAWIPVVAHEFRIHAGESMTSRYEMRSRGPSGPVINPVE